MPLELPTNYSGEDKNIDYTEKFKKIWDNVIPKTFSDILEFDTRSAIWVEHKTNIGPYHIWEKKLFAKIHLILSDRPFYEKGWDGKSELTQKDFEIAYNEDFFRNLRERMYKLSKYLGLHLDNFNLMDNFSITVNHE